MNEKTKQAIEKLRVQVKDIKTLKSIVNLIEIDVDEALALLREDEPCGACGGSKKVPALYGMTQMHGTPKEMVNATKPCPDCQDKPAEKLPQFEDITGLYKDDEPEQKPAEIKTGDQGQRYEVRYINAAGKEKIVGCTDIFECAKSMEKGIILHPSMHSPKIIDRKVNDVKNQIKRCDT